MAYLEGYCNVSFANAINESDDWSDASTSEKQMAITYGRIFIDKNYTCSDTSEWDTSDYTTIPDEVQRANAILAEMHILGTLLTTDPGVSGPITSKKVKAGSVESETTYLGAYSSTPKRIDQKPEITMLLSPYCSLGSSGADLIRV